MNKNSLIFVAGARTLIGGALFRELKEQGYENLLGKEESLDLTDASQVESFFQSHAPEYVFLVAGKSAGILGNQKYPAELIRDNLLVECNIIHTAYKYGVERLLYLASSCSYPKHSPQPMRVESLLTGVLEPSSEAYGIAKIAGIKMCEAYGQQYGVQFIAAIPADAFGPGDDFSLEDSHVIAALIRKMHEAKMADVPSVEIWGSGNQRREFIFADDLADACIFSIQHHDSCETINLGGGTAISIRELADLIKEVVNYRGKLIFNTAKPDGMPLKTLDSTRLRELGWHPKTPLETGLLRTYQWFTQYVAGRATLGT